MESPDSVPRNTEKRRKFEESSTFKVREALDEECGSYDRKHRSSRSRRRGKAEKESSVDATPNRDFNEDALHRSEKGGVESITWKTEDSRGRVRKKTEKSEDSGDFDLAMKRRFEQGKTSTRRKQMKEGSPIREERGRDTETDRGSWLAKEEWVESWELRAKSMYGDRGVEKSEAAATRDRGSGSHSDGTRRDIGSSRKFSTEQKLGKKTVFHGEEEIKARGDTRSHYDDAFDNIPGAKLRREDVKPDREEPSAQSLYADHDRGRNRARGGNGNDFGSERIAEKGTRWQQAENVSTDRKGSRDLTRAGRLEKQGRQLEREQQEEGNDRKLEDAEEVRTARDAREEMWMDGQDTPFRIGDSLRTRKQSRWDESEVPKRIWRGRNEDGSGSGELKSHRQKARENFDFSKDIYEDGNIAFKSGRADRKKNYRDVGGTVREEFEGWERPYDRKRDYREEDDKVDRPRASRDKGESVWEQADDRARSNANLQEEDEEFGNPGRAKDGLELSWEDVEDRRRPGAGRLGKPGRSIKRSWSPEGRRRVRGDYDEYDRDWSDDRKDSERERGYRRDYDRERESYRERERDLQRERDRERDSFRENEFLRERDRARDREDAEGRWKSRQRDRQKEKEEKNEDAGYYFEREGWEMHKRGMGKLDRERMQRTGEERDRMERERSDILKSTQNSGIINEVMERGIGNQFNAADSNRERTFASGQQFPMRRGDSGTYMGDFHGANGDMDWMAEERLHMGDGFQMGGNEFPERFLAEEEGPPGLDQNFAPNSGRMMGDGGMFYNIHAGRGRGLKGSPGHRFRGGQMGSDGRPPFGGNQGSGMMMRGLQQGGKGGRGRGGPKGGRGIARDAQRSGLPPPLMGPGPGPPGPAMAPHFGPLGPPPGAIPGPGPNMGLGPGPGMGPGGFPLPPFGGPMGWHGARGAGEIGMLPGLPGPAPLPASGPAPRFGPNMGPGPGPNVFFSPPGPGRGGPNGPPAPVFGGASFGGRVAVPEKGPVSRVMPRITAPAGRAPSRGEQNDYSQHFVDTGLRPQNFIRDVELSDRFEEYPKLKELITRKDKIITDCATPPMYMQWDLHSTELNPEVFGTKFDVILVDPPWEEYVRRAPGVGDSMEWWPFEEIQNLRIEAIADTPSFIFLWVGDAEGLEQGRLCLKKWGFRRCEDICWVKTNRDNPTPALRHDASTILQHSKEHCLMGIKGTVRRSTDGHIIHANIDTDIIISEEPPYGSTSKPEELYHIIEHFALGQRRLELFGEDHNIRAGWVTVGKGLTSSNFNAQTYTKYFADAEGKVWQGGRGNPPMDAPHLVGTTPEIEALRPKSPPPRAQQQQGSQAANSVSQPSAPNPNAKRAPTTSPQNVQPAGNAATMGSAGQATSNSSVIVLSSSSPVQAAGTGRGGGGHGQIPKPRRSPLSTDLKPPGLADDRIEEEKAIGGDALDSFADKEVPRQAELPADVPV